MSYSDHFGLHLEAAGVSISPNPASFTVACFYSLNRLRNGEMVDWIVL